MPGVYCYKILRTSSSFHLRDKFGFLVSRTDYFPLMSDSRLFFSSTCSMNFCSRALILVTDVPVLLFSLCFSVATSLFLGGSPFRMAFTSCTLSKSIRSFKNFNRCFANY